MDTEANILSTIPDLDDNSIDTDIETGVEHDTTTTETGTETEAGASPVAVVGDGSEGGGTNTPAQPAAPIVRKDGLIEQPSTQNPGARDLVDPQTGAVVARGGIERRIFEGAQRVHRENAQLRDRVTKAEGNANNANEVVRLGTTLNLSPQDQQTSLNIMAQFLKDPVKTLEALVVEVKSKGYEIPFLTAGVTAGMDTAAVNRMLDQRLAPLMAPQQQAQQNARAQEEAKRTLDSFLDSHPEGQHNLGTLAEMMTSQPGLTISDAYTKLIKWCASNGYEYSQPLKPQIEAKQRQQPAAPIVAQTPNQPRQPVAPLPNGRQTTSAAPINTAASFDENSSFGDIIRHAMRESGMSA